MATASKYLKKVTKRRKLRPRPLDPSGNNPTRSLRQVTMKAKQQLATKRIDPATKNVLMRKIPQPIRLRKRRRRTSTLVESTVCNLPSEVVLSAVPRLPDRPVATHPYLLRSRSSLDHNSRNLFSSMDSFRRKSSNSLLGKERTTSSRDSGIESATNTSDSEDSNESAFISSPSPPVLQSITSVTPISESEPSPSPSNPQTAPDTANSKNTSVQSEIHTVNTVICAATNGLSISAVPSHSDDFLSYEHEDMPEFLQDIDEVISADAKEGRTADDADVQKDPITINENSSCSLTESVMMTHEISLCHEQLPDDSSMEVVMEKRNTYIYTASAGELEFVTEIFRGVQRMGQTFRPPAVLPPKTRSSPRYTLILDLDETLVHCFTNDPPEKYDHHFNVSVTDTVTGGEPTDLAVFARLRPYVNEFLERMAKKFEVVVFTASMKNYSSKMLDLLDPEGVLIKHRFYRDHCVPVGGSFVKDLSIFTRDLSKMIIVDNQIASFAFQIENGVPIRSWIGDDHDRELMHLADYLERIADHEDLDVRQFIRESLGIQSQLQSHVDMYYSSLNAGFCCMSSWKTVTTTTMSPPTSPIFSSHPESGIPYVSASISTSEELNLHPIMLPPFHDG